MSDNKKEKSQIKKIKRQNKRLEKRKSSIFYYMIPGNANKELKRMGVETSFKKALGTYLTPAVLLYLLGHLFALPFYWNLCLSLFGVMIAPIMLRNKCVNAYENARFSDACRYLEQLLWSFKDTGKVSTSLNEIRPLFKDGPMRDSLDDAVNHIMSPDNNSDDNLEEEALKIIATRYDSKYVKKVHKFILSVESIGGNFDNSILLLLEDLASWEKRIYKLRDGRITKRADISISCAMAAFLCLITLGAMPDNMTPDSLLSDISNVCLIVGLLIVYLKTDLMLCKNLLEDNVDGDDRSIIDDYHRYVNYDDKAAKILSFKYAIVPGIITFIFMFIYPNLIGFFISASITAICAFQHILGQKVLYSKLRREINNAYTQWLMDIALYLQMSTIDVAVLQSVETSPPALVPELEILGNRIMEDPNDVNAYLEFAETFNLPEITTSMRMLVSLRQGSGGDISKQISNIISRNNLMLERVEERQHELSLAKMQVLFLLPMLFATVCLMVNMVVSLSGFMDVMNQI